MTQCHAPWVAQALTIIKKWEGCKLTAYPDPATSGAPWTIGYGQTGPHVEPGLVWTQAQADEALLHEVLERGRAVDRMAKDPLEPHEKAALVSFAFNVGITALMKSTLLRLVNAGHRSAAADQFARWNKAAGRVMAGLTNRRADERALFLGA